MDTGYCIPESEETLLKQQRQLVSGRRDVQMFPLGTKELELLPGFLRHENFRGVFHYKPKTVTVDQIDFCSLRGRENELLNLGPFSKVDIFSRLNSGEKGTCIVEYTPDGTEVRSAFGTTMTCGEQRAYFERTKEPENIIVVGELPPRVLNFIKKG